LNPGGVEPIRRPGQQRQRPIKRAVAGRKTKLDRVPGAGVGLPKPGAGIGNSITTRKWASQAGGFHRGARGFHRAGYFKGGGGRKLKRGVGTVSASKRAPQKNGRGFRAGSAERGKGGVSPCVEGEKKGGRGCCGKPPWRIVRCAFDQRPGAAHMGAGFPACSTEAVPLCFLKGTGGGWEPAGRCGRLARNQGQAWGGGKKKTRSEPEKLPWEQKKKHFSGKSGGPPGGTAEAGGGLGTVKRTACAGRAPRFNKRQGCRGGGAGGI